MSRRLDPVARGLLKDCLVRVPLRSNKAMSWVTLSRQWPFGVLTDWLQDHQDEQALAALGWALKAHRAVVGPYGGHDPINPRPGSYWWYSVGGEPLEMERHWLPFSHHRSGCPYPAVDFLKPEEAWEWLLVEWGLWGSHKLEGVE
jgi:hypothetical protein